MIGVPLQNGNPYFDLQVPLDGATYTLVFRWNVRLGAWFFDVLDEESQVAFADGLCMRSGSSISASLTGKPWPGFFVCYDTSGAGADPGLNDLQTRHLLLYFEKSDLAVIGL